MKKSWIYLAGIVFVLLTGCARAQREVKEPTPLASLAPEKQNAGSQPSQPLVPVAVMSPSPTSSSLPVAQLKTVTQLGLRIVPGGAGGDAVIPSFKEFSETPRDLEKGSANETEFNYLQVIPLPRPGVDRPLHFAWKQMVLGSEIQDASFQFRVIDSRNQPVWNTNRQPVNIDKERKLWYIPFESLYAGRESALDPASLNVLDLSLTLQDRGVLSFQIRFRARGPLSLVGLDNGFRVNLSAGHFDMARIRSLATTLGQGLEVRRDSLSNPDNRRLKVWFQPQINQLEWITGISSLKYFPGGTQEVPGSSLEYFRAVGQGKVQKLRFSSNQGRTGEISFDPNNGLSSLDLMPGETLSLSWVAFPYHAGKCALPPHWTREIVWGIPQPERCSRGECSSRPDRIVRHVRTDQMDISALKTEGEFRYRMWITDREFQGDPANPDPQWARYVSSPKDETVSLHGEAGNPGNGVICHGVY